MLLFLDTEFTGLSHPAHARKLLSLALVSEDGRAQWYAELDGWNLTDCDDWVQRHVVPLLTGPSLSRDAARASLLDWLSAMPRHVQAACDSPIDFHFLLQLLGGRPSSLDLQRHDLAPLINTASYNNAVATYFAKGHPEHHALHDARAYRLGWLAWMDARKSNANQVSLRRMKTQALSMSASHTSHASHNAVQEFGFPPKTSTARAREQNPDSLQDLKKLVVGLSTSGVLQADIRAIVEYNRQQAVAQAAPTQPGTKVP